MGLTNSKPQLIDHSTSSVDLADGDITIADLIAAAGLGIAGIEELVHLGREGGKSNKLVAEPCSSTIANNDTGTYALWAGVFLYGDGPLAAPTGANMTKLGTGTVTIGTKVGLAGELVGADHRFGDGLTWTETDAYADIRAGLGADAAGAHSPADNTIAKLVLGELGFADFVAIESITGLKWRVVTGA